MLAFIRNLFERPGKDGRGAGSAAAAGAAGEAAHKPAAQRRASRSFAKMYAKSLALGKEDGRYRMFEARPDAGMRPLLGCGPTLNVDGTPMVGDTGFDERGRPYGVIEDFG